MAADDHAASIRDFGTNALIDELVQRGDLGLALERASRELRGFRRALVEHHALHSLSDDVIARYDWRECPVCREARGG